MATEKLKLNKVMFFQANFKVLYIPNVFRLIFGIHLLYTLSIDIVFECLNDRAVKDVDQHFIMYSKNSSNWQKLDDGNS